ncbi:hypothetical protein SLIQ_24790, partial [Serratia liquefaciens FK01]
GAKRDRTADLLRARQALSQLSYSPIQSLADTFVTSFDSKQDAAPRGFTAMR